ncbi:hypothetical protein [Azohydromonas lata]|uniref:Ppx/GppA phosphatase C-terminal domain-containing protein n=1 Tax=Azohydromonas lata TaxID=45677 RepID=A0ABU5IFM9_9BURK|nr:hypothetical protein [Azohydromonas lata]MDZ5457455.1 hypothetical protein [Azohydromonas lata]
MNAAATSALLLCTAEPAVPAPDGAAAVSAANLRDAAVAALQRQFGCDLAQARRVREVALALHRDAAPDAGLEEYRELAWACALHELGRCISHHDHHRHGAYLVEHADAAGFTAAQQRRLADLVLAQRGGLKKLEAALARRPFARQVLCLRLAAIRCHARRDVAGPRLRLQTLGGRRHALRWERASPPADPRTLHLLQEEVALWAQQGPLELLLQAP